MSFSASRDATSAPARERGPVGERRVRARGVGDLGRASVAARRRVGGARGPGVEASLARVTHVDRARVAVVARTAGPARARALFGRVSPARASHAPVALAGRGGPPGARGARAVVGRRGRPGRANRANCPGAARGHGALGASRAGRVARARACPRDALTWAARRASRARRAAERAPLGARGARRWPCGRARRARGVARRAYAVARAGARAYLDLTRRARRAWSARSGPKRVSGAAARAGGRGRARAGCTCRVAGEQRRKLGDLVDAHEPVPERDEPRQEAPQEIRGVVRGPRVGLVHEHDATPHALDLREVRVRALGRRRVARPVREASAARAQIALKTSPVGRSGRVPVGRPAHVPAERTDVGVHGRCREHGVHPRVVRAVRCAKHPHLRWSPVGREENVGLGELRHELPVGHFGREVPMRRRVARHEVPVPSELREDARGGRIRGRPVRVRERGRSHLRAGDEERGAHAEALQIPGNLEPACARTVVERERQGLRRERRSTVGRGRERGARGLDARLGRGRTREGRDDTREGEHEESTT